MPAARARILSSTLALLLGLLMFAPAAGAQTSRSEAVRLQQYHARADSIIGVFADRVAPTDLTAGGSFEIAANLFRGTNLDWCVARLDSLMAVPPRGDMFWMYPNVLVTFAGRDSLPADTRARMRDQWRTYMPYRGDTENHWAMYYASLYLMTQEYPDDPASRWYNGRSSVENHAEARDYLLSWMDLTTTIGQGEFDSPGYIDFYVVSMALLHAYADDPEIRQRAGMMVEYLLADFAVESLDGLYVGAFSRIYPVPLVERLGDNSTAFAWLLFGNTQFLPRGGALILAMSGYTPSAVLDGIGTDRSTPYLHRELKRTRHRIRYSAERNVPVYKTTYMRPEYAVGSIQGGLLQPIQQHTWEVFWRTDTGTPGDHTMLFTVHPYSSAHELAMYFPEEPENLTEAVARSKGTYDQADKWTSGSPFEQVVQQEDAVVVLYDIPPGTRFPHIAGFFPKTLSARDVDASGWIFARGGDALIAYYPLAPYQWREEEGAWRLHSDALKNGAVVQVAPASDFPSFDAFKAAVLALPLQTSVTPTPSVRFTTLRGARIETTYGQPPQINGALVYTDAWPLFDGPFLRAERGSRMLDMRHGPLRRRLDFNTMTITDWVGQ